MKNILIISPISIAGELILKGFKSGFDALGHNTCFIDVRQVNDNSCTFIPDVVLSYDFGWMITENAISVVMNMLENNPNLRLIHYFADEPLLKYAHSGNTELVNKFKSFCKKHSKNVELLFWDKKCLGFCPEVKSSYFPICVDCDIYRDYNLAKKYDITFVGRPLGKLRQELLSDVVKNFGNGLKIFSYPKHFETSVDEMKRYLNKEELETYKNSFSGFVKSQSELSKIYNSSKINLNINLQGESSLNYRTFEVLASKGFLLHDKRSDIKSLGLCDVLVEYDDGSDLMQKIEYYIDADSEREKIGARARKLIVERYNIIARAGEILNIVE